MSRCGVSRLLARKGPSTGPRASSTVSRLLSGQGAWVCRLASHFLYPSLLPIHSFSHNGHMPLGLHCPVPSTINSFPPWVFAPFFGRGPRKVALVVACDLSPSENKKTWGPSVQCCRFLVYLFTSFALHGIHSPACLWSFLSTLTYITYQGQLAGDHLKARL